MKKNVSILLVLLFLMSFSTFPSCAEETLNIAFQYGLAYAPLIVMQEQRLIEAAYREASGKEVSVIWQQMSSGADINIGIASGSIQIGFMGVAPAITGVGKHVGYKIFTNLSGQEHGLMVNRDDINGFADLIGSDDQLALVNLGSIQHILLAKTLVAAGYDAHALDTNLVAMKHPDGMTSLLTGSVAAHVTTNPYIYKERSTEGLHEIENMPAIWPVENSFIVGVASEDLFYDDPVLYEAVCTAVTHAIEFINADPEAAAAITCTYNGNSFEDELTYLRLGSYGTETRGVTELAAFMYAQAFIESDPGGYSDLVFDNVKGN